ncbi:hypothetical protein LJE72_17785 [Desulfosporosinus sp. SRJS8]|nr:hypothetical protein [Desulfosporosinus sp. SRJS8]
MINKNMENGGKNMMKKNENEMYGGIEKVKRGKKNTVHSSTIWQGWSKPQGADNGLMVYRHVQIKKKD